MNLFNMSVSLFLQYLVSVPLRMFRLWAFMGMMAQVLTFICIGIKNCMLCLWKLSKPASWAVKIHAIFSFLLFYRSLKTDLHFRSHWHGLCPGFFGATMEMPLFGCHSLLVNLSPFSCMFMTTMSQTTKTAQQSMKICNKAWVVHLVKQLHY